MYTWVKVPPLVGDPDQRGDYSGGGGRGYWLWMNALRTALTAADLPENLAELVRRLKRPYRTDVLPGVVNVKRRMGKSAC